MENSSNVCIIKNIIFVFNAMEHKCVHIRKLSIFAGFVKEYRFVCIIRISIFVGNVMEDFYAFMEKESINAGNVKEMQLVNIVVKKYIASSAKAPEFANT